MNSDHVAHLQRMANESWIGSPERAALDAAIASLSAPQPPADTPVCTGDEIRCHDGHGCECAMRGQPPAEAQPVERGWCDACEGAGHTPDAEDPFARPVCCPDCAGSGLAEHSITANRPAPPSAPVGVEGLPAKWRAEADEIAANNWACNSNSIRARADELENALAQQPAAVDEAMVSLVEKCRKAFAEELSAYDIDPPIAHVKEAHDACVEFLDAQQQGGDK